MKMVADKPVQPAGVNARSAAANQRRAFSGCTEIPAASRQKIGCTVFSRALSTVRHVSWNGARACIATPEEQTMNSNDTQSRSAEQETARKPNSRRAVRFAKRRAAAKKAAETRRGNTGPGPSSQIGPLNSSVLPHRN
jgi:hypothetical protein